MALTSCDKYKLFKADGEGGGEELYSTLRSAAMEKFLLKYDLPIDLDMNNYYIECRYFEEFSTNTRLSLREFKDKTFEREIKDNRGAYTCRRG